MAGENYRKYPDRVPINRDGSDIASTASDAMFVQLVTPDAGTAIIDDTLDAVVITGALTASTVRIGTVSGALKTVTVRTDLAATGNVYAANDVMAAATTGAVAWVFAEVVRINGAYGYITTAVVACEQENVTPRITMYFFNAAPTGCNLNDHIANTAPDCDDITKYLGKIDFPALESLGTTDSNAIATPSTVGNLPLAFKCATDDLYAVVVTRDAATIAAGDDLTIALTIEQY